MQGSGARKDANEVGEREMPMLMSSMDLHVGVRGGGARIGEEEVDVVTSPRR